MCYIGLVHIFYQMKNRAKNEKLGFSEGYTATFMVEPCHIGATFWFEKIFIKHICNIRLGNMMVDKRANFVASCNIEPAWFL